MGGDSGVRKKRRRLQRSIKQQTIDYTVLRGDRWSQSIRKTIEVGKEIVPPEHERSPRRFLGYTTLFEALAVAETHPNRISIIYQTELDPVIPKSKQHWFGRFHVFLAKKERSRRMRATKAVRWLLMNPTEMTVPRRCPKNRSCRLPKK